MEDIVSEAWRIGQGIDLSGIGYGRIHWGNKTDIREQPFSYYFFLAGIVRLLNATTLVEVGTHQGGSARAMAAGFQDPGVSRLLTFDVTPDGASMLAGDPVIRAVTMDANTEEAHELTVQFLGDQALDMTYIDATHRFLPTLINFSIYGEALKARFVVLDDVTMNDSMAAMWQHLKARYQGDAIDAAAVIPAIRPKAELLPGFGVIRLRGQT
jgi:predicted O-methyltransferase YrrM